MQKDHRHIELTPEQLEQRREEIKRMFGESVKATEPVKPVVYRYRRKIGRNEPCPCNSGLKYKKCCLGK